MVTGALPACRTDPSDSAGLRNHHDSIPKFGRLIVSRHTDFGPSSYLQPCSRQVHLASSFEHLVEKIDQVNLALLFSFNTLMRFLLTPSHRIISLERVAIALARRAALGTRADGLV